MTKELEANLRFRKDALPDQATRVSKVSSYADYLQRQAGHQNAGQSILAFEKAAIPTKDPGFVRGHCYLCGKLVDFKVSFEYAYDVDGILMPNWRETLDCPNCSFNSRMRASIHLFELECQPRHHARIYLTEQTTYLYRWFRSNYSDVVGSEFLGDSLGPGETNADGLRNEDVTRLSFADGEFDFILSFDVFEHVPGFRAALQESFRCLKPGGTLFFSVPFVMGSEKNIVRAVIRDGEIEHLLPPEYHGDPLSTEGCLCFYHFGWELLEDLRAAGFEDVNGLVYWAAEFGYLGGEQIVFKATKKLG